ncbi:MAG: alpha-amylase [Azospirillum sp.]|nr:alpha-amylase [Azospirillum sp.]
MPDSTGPVIYNLFPRLLGPVSAWTGHLPRIAAMGFDWVYVNPFHFPGFSGSLYAIKEYYALNPAFDDGSGRPADQQLRDFTAAAEAQGLGVMMDLVINHTARDCPLTENFPDWYERDQAGTVQSPFAVDPNDPSRRTVWGDLAALDYRDRPQRAEMIAYFCDVALHYARLGFHGFRCDAAYQVPGAVWAAVIAAVRRVCPEALFAAETLGCTPDQVAQLKPAGFDFIFNSVKWWNFRDSWLLEQYQAFRGLAPSIGFPESHDTERLIAEVGAGPEAARHYRQRYLVAAVFSTGVMMPIGYEFGFSKKPDVVSTTPDDWEAAAFDLTSFATETNRMRTQHRVFNQPGPQQRFTFEDPAVVALYRRTLDNAGFSLAFINTDTAQPHVVWLDGEWLAELPDGLLAEAGEVTPGRRPEAVRAGAALGLAPGEVRVFVKD